MNKRQQIEQLRGEWVTKSVAHVKTGDRTVELIALGYENYPEPSFWHVVVDGSIATNWNNYNEAIWEARDEEEITHAEATALELAYASVDGFGW
jgi:hypothetical protein